ncbi:hypothetical protein N7481_000855, partial [Penicillium waksmanii]|uniref:uncharacterized protein n=1 Tax=Penicillium waksmanii TaxID=69791 RepID=UPI0025472AF8
AFSPNYPLTEWRPAGPDDERAPCPMLNALASHGYLPHDGKDIGEETIVHAFGTALNFEKIFSQTLFKNALTTNPNATTFSLANLNRHNIFEQNGSLNRGDFYFGDDPNFNQTTFDETRSYWPTAHIDPQSAARARQARVNTSNRTNPEFKPDDTGKGNSFEGSAAYIMLGNKTTGVARKSWVEYLFENERLPYELGCDRAQEAISLSDFGMMVQRVVNATESAKEQ